MQPHMRREIPQTLQLLPTTPIRQNLMNQRLNEINGNPTQAERLAIMTGTRNQPFRPAFNPRSFSLPNRRSPARPNLSALLHPSLRIPLPIQEPPRNKLIEVNPTEHISKHTTPSHISSPVPYPQTECKWS